MPEKTGVMGVEQIPWLYDLGMAVLEHGAIRRWRAWLVAGARGRVLEIGAGTGRALPLYPAGSRVVATDPHLPNLAVAARRAPAVPLVCARAEALPFRDGAFETVVSSLVLCSVDAPAAALAEVGRVLAAGGSLRALEHVRARRSWAARLQDAVQPAWTRVVGGCRPNRDTEAAVRAAGFRIADDGREERGVLRRFEAAPPK